MRPIRVWIATIALSVTALAVFSTTGMPAQQSTTASPAAATRDWQHYPHPPKAPRGAPNVLLIMTDDVGFSATSTFGGAIPTPVFDALAEQGLRYNQFHTTAMCSPSRAALLTGRNHHAVEFGALSNLSTDQKGYTSVIPGSAATIGRVLKINGYATAFIGKNHNTPVWETGPTGPFDRWPNAWGFEYFYGFNAVMSDQFAPDLVENRNPVYPSADNPGYNLDRDLADRLLHWLRIQHTIRPDKPFFAYWAPGTVHSPHQAPADWIARFRGRFDQGWDKLREETFRRQKKMGVIPANAFLTPRPPGLPAWDSLTAEQQRVAARMMEVAAAQLAQLDYQIGRVVDWLKASGQFDNTLIIYVQGDNGGSIESRLGANLEMMTLLGLEPTYEELAQGIDTHGGPFSFGNYPAAWSWATNTPFQWGKQIASHLGGMRGGLVITWPKRIKTGGAVRNQFSHVIDIAPTIYEAAGVTPPTQVDGIAQQPIDGVSMIYTFDAPKAPARHREQYFELLGNRAYYADGWLASTTPQIPPWDRTVRAADYAKYDWELYDLRSDYSQGKNLAAQHPQKLAELKAKFDAAAKKFHVYPLGAPIMTRLAASNRPNLLTGRKRFTYYPGDTRYPANSFPTIRPGWSLTAHVHTASSEAHGTLVFNGDHSSGYALMLENGFPVFLYSPTGRAKERIRLTARQPLASGQHDVAVSFAADLQAGQRAARLSLLVDGKPVETARVPVTFATFGYTYVGRPGIRELLPGMRSGQLTGAVLGSVDVELK